MLVEGRKYGHCTGAFKRGCLSWSGSLSPAGLGSLAGKSCNFKTESDVRKPNLGHAESFGTETCGGGGGERHATPACQGPVPVLSSPALSDPRAGLGRGGLNWAFGSFPVSPAKGDRPRSGGSWRGSGFPRCRAAEVCARAARSGRCCGGAAAGAGAGAVTAPPSPAWATAPRPARRRVGRWLRRGRARCARGHSGGSVALAVVPARSLRGAEESEEEWFFSWGRGARRRTAGKAAAPPAGSRHGAGPPPSLRRGEARGAGGPAGDGGGAVAKVMGVGCRQGLGQGLLPPPLFFTLSPCVWRSGCRSALPP